MLGFVKRTVKSFVDANLLKTLYNSLIRSHLDYCSNVWSPSSKADINTFLSFNFLCFKRKLAYSSSNLQSNCHDFNFCTLEAWRNIFDSSLLHKVLYDQVKCPQLLSAISLNVPVRRTRQVKLFLFHAFHDFQFAT